MKKLLLACLLASLPFTIASADLKVAVIDLNKTFDSYWKTKEADDRLREKKEAYSKEVQDLINDYQHMGDEADALDKASKDPTLAPAAQQEKGKALLQKKQDLVALGNKIQEMKVERSKELEEEFMRRRKEIVDEITKVVTEYSGPQGFDLVIDKSSVSASSGVSVILYNSSKLIDITADVVKSLNKTAPAPGTTSAGTAPTPASPISP